ncbi:unnamed protein product, partial [Owenia fusiformis]
LGLGSEGASVMQSSNVIDGSGPIWLDDMNCAGNERTLFECRHSGWGVENCGHHEDVGVSCNGGLRLVGGVTSGRLEVFYSGRWGTVCDDGFDMNDAKIACRHLGFGSGRASVIQSSNVPDGKGSIWLDDMNCAGMEGTLFQCRHAGWGVHNCGHREDVGVSCNGG